MIEILKIIVMVCNINTGHKAVAFLEVNARECRNELIRCVDKEKKYVDGLKKCLLEQK
jgi:hypothetical protein